MDGRCSHNTESALDLKLLPPIDPFRIMSSSFSKGKLKNSSNRAYTKLAKPSPNPEMELLDSDEGMRKGFARSNLYEICAANHWTPPVFECHKKEGPSHRTMFTFKVTIEIEDASVDIIECYGAPCRKKKTAADHAAEGALWYLKHMGYGMKNH